MQVAFVSMIVILYNNANLLVYHVAEDDVQYTS